MTDNNNYNSSKPFTDGSSPTNGREIKKKKSTMKLDVSYLSNSINRM